MVNPDPNKVVDSLHEWITEEIKTTSARYFELGKFFFGVSAGTVAAIEVITKALPSFKYSENILLASFFFVGISLIVAVLLVTPKEWLLSGDVHLEKELNKLIGRYRTIVWSWFATWFIGVAIAIISFWLKAHPAATGGATPPLP
jgi:hypothetical protein